MVSTLQGVKIDVSKNSVLSVDDTVFLRGFWCVIVVLVHVPAEYQNPLQDMIGSFAYIGVTFFFMTSSFGLMYGMEHKKDYIKNFWRKRLPSILIPAILCNLLNVVFRTVEGEPISILSFINIDAWVKVLLLYYFMFWIVKIIPEKSYGGKYCKDAVICLVIALINLIGRLLNGELSLWFTESYGFIYGIILYDISDIFKDWTNRKWTVKTALFFIMSAVVGMMYKKFKLVNFWGDYCLKIVLGISITILILMLIRRFKVENRIMRFLGEISYEVYLIHGILFRVLIMLNPDMNSSVFILAVLFLTIVVAYILRIVTYRLLTLIRLFLPV